jgi:hypothetical protein
MKWPTPSPVDFSGDTDSMTDTTEIRSPNTSGRS